MQTTPIQAGCSAPVKSPAPHRAEAEHGVITVRDLENIEVYFQKLREYRERMKEKYLQILLQAKNWWELKKAYENLLESLSSKKMEIVKQRDEVRKKLSKSPELIRYSKELKIEEDKIQEEINGLNLAFGEARRKLPTNCYHK